MSSVETISNFENGDLLANVNVKSLSNLEWNPHKICKGVYLKHLLVSSDSDNQISCHIVKIEPNSVINFHVHESNLEIHEVISGDGILTLGEEEYNYKPGNISFIPKNIKHEVKAGKKGLYLLAKFVPALV